MDVEEACLPECLSKSLDLRENEEIIIILHASDKKQWYMGLVWWYKCRFEEIFRYFLHTFFYHIDSQLLEPRYMESP